MSFFTLHAPHIDAHNGFGPWCIVIQLPFFLTELAETSEDVQCGHRPFSAQ